MEARRFSFIGGSEGAWKVTDIRPVAGEGLRAVNRIEVAAGLPSPTTAAAWILQGIISNERYVTRGEKRELVERQEGLGRPGATRGALIPIRKSDAWWALAQDERRALFEETSNHIRIGMKYLPAIARRLHHCRDLGEPQPFDFLTWFEYDPEDGPAFEELVAALRSTVEWTYVEREVDIRVVREA